jgi:hypothetical protein
MTNGYDYAGLDVLAEPVHLAALEFEDAQGAGVIAERAGLELAETLVALEDLQGAKLVTKYANGGRAKWYASRKKARLSGLLAGDGNDGGDGEFTSFSNAEKPQAAKKQKEDGVFDAALARIDDELARLDNEIAKLSARRDEIETARGVLAGL